MVLMRMKVRLMRMVAKQLVADVSDDDQVTGPEEARPT